MEFLGPLQLIFDKAPIFALVLFRVSGLMIFAPLLGLVAIPVKIKALIALVLAVVIFPLVPQIALVPASMLGLAVAAGSELLIGISMGFVLSLLFVGIQLGADMISYQMGLSMSKMVDPTTEANTTVMSQIYMMVATVIYLLLNGHLVLIRSLVDTFKTVPLMGLPVTENFLKFVISTFTTVLTGSFVFAIRMAAPALIAIFLATLALGFISRTMPQLNILAAGFPIRIVLALVIMTVSMGMVGVLFQDSLVSAFSAIGSLFI